MSGGGRKISRRANQAVSSATSRVARHEIALGLIVAAIGIFLAYVAWVSVNGPPFQHRYKLEAVLAGSDPIVKSGDTVRMGGRLAGFITKVEPDGPNRRVAIELRSGFGPVGENATARVRVRSIVYLTYVELNPGDRGNPMPDGGTIPLARTSAGVDLLSVVQLFDQRTREELSRSLVNTGIGVAGRGAGLNAALANLDETLLAGTPELRALTRQPGALGATVAGAARVAGGLTGNRPDDVGSLIGSGSAVLGTVGGRSAALGRSLELLRPFEDQLIKTAPLANPLLDDAGALARQLSPAARTLNKGLPQLNRLLSLGGTLRAESGRLPGIVDPVLRLAGPQLYALYPTFASLNPILTSLSSTLKVLLPYQGDITNAGLWAVSATQRSYPQGQTAPDNPALRFVPILGCNRPRNPFPAPGQALKDSQAC